METSSWLQTALDWIQLHPNATGWMIFLVALGESLLLVGIILPGAALLVGLGTLIGLGVVDFKLAWITASLGAFAGDGISFWIGLHYKQGLLKMWPMYKFPKLIEQGQSFFKKWGLLSVFIGRFIGLVRPIIPAIAGVMEMPIKKYIAISTLSAILWSPFYLVPGMLFGNAMGAMSKVAGKLAILVLVFVFVVAVVYWLIQLLYSLLLPRTHRILSRALVWSQKHPHLGRLTSGLIDPRKPEKGSLALMATFVIVLTIVSLFFIANNQTIAGWSLAVSAFMQAFHTDWTQPVMLYILSTTHDLAILLPSLIVFWWLIRRKRTIAAYHWIFVVVTGYILSLCINYFSADETSSWFGYQHLTWFICIIGFWAALISGALPHKSRSWPYTLATLLIALVAFAQLFFKQMSLGVVMIAIFSAILWASIVAIAYRMRVRKQFLGWHISALFFSFQTVAMITVLIFFAGQLKTIESQELMHLSQQQWNNCQLAERNDWLNRPQQPFNIHFNGEIKQLADALVQQGWYVHTPNAWQDVWKALRNDKDSKEFIIIPTTNKGKIESIILFKPFNDKLVALHLWQQALQLEENKLPVYAGFVSSHQLKQEWGITFWKSFSDNSALTAFLKSIKASHSFHLHSNNTQYYIQRKAQ